PEPGPVPSSALRAGRPAPVATRTAAGAPRASTPFGPPASPRMLQPPNSTAGPAGPENAPAGAGAGAGAGLTDAALADLAARLAPLLAKGVVAPPAARGDPAGDSAAGATSDDGGVRTGAEK
ncbi:hypothetical protein MNEG_14003, partial [Monoraphidium neglectum]